MTKSRLFSLIGGVAVAILLCAAGELPPDGAPQFDKDGRLLFPSDYRDWMFLSSGLDMSYSASSQSGNAHTFNNAFVQRSAYQAFLKTGTWPDKTTILLENRSGGTDVSINRRGVVQTQQLQGFEVHVKDTTRFKGGWVFFGFGSDKPAEVIPASASCYSCHQEHGAVDTTFVQFYPTLLPVAAKLGTLSPSYVADSKANGGK